MNFHVATLGYFYRLNMKIGSKHFDIRLTGQCTRTLIALEWEKCCDSESNQPNSCCDVSNETIRLWNYYKMIYSDIKALRFLELSTQKEKFIEKPSAAFRFLTWSPSTKNFFVKIQHDIL